ncbi:hypothetical protein PR048_029747 [Dryococelus australis]|uniref:Uncharacterized protein n=1 Tax=Dryococelus australis TaxID=614101 RepID=A0ABQ9GEU8_9NEOP|nr:hypothetical protein PR048_029747 [Dryococelus australis]
MPFIQTFLKHEDFHVVRERLHAKQKQSSVLEHELIQMVDTHWNSEYHMLSRLLKHKQFIMADLVENRSDHLTAKE